MPARSDSVAVGRRVLGRTGLAISEIGFGCGPTAGLIAAGQRDAQRAAVQRALELGIDYFDTAPVYAAGESERNLGAVLHDLKATPRVATKVALERADFGDIRGAILRSVEGSLARLKLPRVAVLHLHNRVATERAAKAEFGSGAQLRVDDVLGARGVAETFASLRDQGVVDFFGCSAYGGDMAAVAQVVDSGAFDCLQVHYSVLNTSAWEPAPAAGRLRDYHGIAARAAAAGLGVIALRVLEAGLLTDRPPGAQRVRADGEASAVERDSLAALLGGESLGDVALRFALARPETTTALVGFSSVAQVEEAVASVIKGALSPSLRSRIETWRAETLGEPSNRWKRELGDT
ncbi:MAG TPA: aldo/keto reductase [Gammaproteobacteria bacterium]|nr:aldo/keto reductase [Gammaproteobacteria bacterium]